MPSPSKSSKTSSQKVASIEKAGSVVFAQIVYVVLSIASVGVPVMMPVAGSSTRPAGRAGETAHVAPATALGG